MTQENDDSLANGPLKHMLAAWNERDPEKIRGHLELALAPEVEFCDPQHHVTGLDRFETMVREFRAGIPDARCAHTSELDAHHNRVRYSWGVYDGENLLVPGFDVVTFADDGRVLRIDGFFGPLSDLA
ncbi:MAG: hypothetical protein ACI8TX_002953 [Hyphomicrobiaceae bacterium]|jgi:hypothetical protein